MADWSTGFDTVVQELSPISGLKTPLFGQGNRNFSRQSFAGASRGLSAWIGKKTDAFTATPAPPNALPLATVSDLFTYSGARNTTDLSKSAHIFCSADLGAASTLLFAVRATNCPDMGMSGAGPACLLFSALVTFSDGFSTRLSSTSMSTSTGAWKATTSILANFRLPLFSLEPTASRPLGRHGDALAVLVGQVASGSPSGQGRHGASDDHGGFVLWANGVQVGTAPNETGQVQPWHWEPVLRLTLSLVYTDNRLVSTGARRFSAVTSAGIELQDSRVGPHVVQRQVLGTNLKHCNPLWTLALDWFSFVESPWSSRRSSASSLAGCAFAFPALSRIATGSQGRAHVVFEPKFSFAHGYRTLHQSPPLHRRPLIQREESSSLLLHSMGSTDTSVFALIVGIDKYAYDEKWTLKECVNDANLIESFITTTFATHSIHRLDNEAATRQDILHNFHSHLIENPNINPGDTIIFYFAGHGSRVAAPEGWQTNDGLIETICPYDQRALVNGVEQGVPGIPDVTIAALLRELARRRGSNITVILDCCHSGGATRAPGEILERSLPPDYLPFPDIDRDIWTHDSSNFDSTTKPPGIGGVDCQHVLLAACGELQTAFDGYFTRLLVKGLNKKPSTYADLLVMVPPKLNRSGIALQHPQCEWNKNRLLFTTLIALDNKAFRLTKGDDGRYTVAAWAIHGVQIGMLFRVINPPAVLRVTEILKSSSILDVHDASADIPSGVAAFAMMNLGMKVFLEPPFSLPPDLSMIDSCFTIVPERQGADLILSLESLDDEKNCASRAWIHFSVAWPAMSPTWTGMKSAIISLVLSTRLHTFGTISEDTVTLDATLRCEKDVKYGIRLRSKPLQSHLFFYVFYMDPSDFSIQAWHLPKPPPNPACETVRIGYGAGGGYPIGFELEGKDYDAGFLKVFVSTEYADMRSLAQGSAATQRIQVTRSPDILGIWGAWLGAITVYRILGRRSSTVGARSDDVTRLATHCQNAQERCMNKKASTIGLYTGDQPTATLSLSDLLSKDH
ncbi:caspase domain-containing protein [Mycena leptocephala]|nr:caspase domain-containing protein [Mycena leptocephala]